MSVSVERRPMMVLSYCEYVMPGSTTPRERRIRPTAPTAQPTHTKTAFILSARKGESVGEISTSGGCRKH
jgi:hypothetical protein